MHVSRTAKAAEGWYKGHISTFQVKNLSRGGATGAQTRLGAAVSVQVCGRVCVRGRRFPHHNPKSSGVALVSSSVHSDKILRPKCCRGDG